MRINYSESRLDETFSRCFHPREDMPLSLSRVANVRMCVFRGSTRVRYAHRVRTYTRDDLAYTIFECRLEESSRQRLILFSRISARVHVDAALCAAHAPPDARSYTRTSDASRRYSGRVSIGSSIATDACCYAARATLSRFRLLRFSNFCPLPLLASLPRVVPPVTHREAFFALFAT